MKKTSRRVPISVGETFRRLTPKVAVVATCDGIPNTLVDGHDSGSTVILDQVATLIDIGRVPSLLGLLDTCHAQDS